MLTGLHALTHTRHQDNTHNNAGNAYKRRILVVNPNEREFWLKLKDTSGFAESPREAATSTAKCHHRHTGVLISVA